MLQDCLEVFETFEKTKGNDGDLVLDNYLPKDGTYVIVNVEESEVERVLTIHYDKKKQEIQGKSDSYYRDVKYYDYHSSLVSMNKPINGGNGKIIHSNNYLSFFVKKESLNDGKLSSGILDRYYNTLSNPRKKYEGKRKSKELYEETEREIGNINEELLGKCKKWIEENIFCLSNFDIDVSGKDYLKIFFVLTDKEKTKKLYSLEGKRYVYPNIFNNNDYNENFQGEIWGMPDNNMVLNSKKPFLEHRTRMNTYPRLIKKEDVFRQKRLFDYLASLASKGKVNVYFDFVRNEIFSYSNSEIPNRDIHGVYLRLQKEKEVKIIETEVVAGYQTTLRKPFDYVDVLRPDEQTKDDGSKRYGRVRTLSGIAGLLDEVVFSKWLSKNYFTEAKDLKISGGQLKQNLLVARRPIFRWIYQGEMDGISETLQRVSLSMVFDAIEKNNRLQALHRMNMRLSLQDYFNWNKESTMEIIEIRELLRKKINSAEDSQIESGDEYFYAVGQILYYFFSLSKSKNTSLSLANPILNAKSDEIIKDKLRNLFVKYNYSITMDKKCERARRLYAMVAGHQTDGKANKDMLLSGLLSSSLVYEKSEEDD